MLKPILALFLLASPAFAQTPSTGEEIRAAVSGNTVQGSMTASGAYTEFYAEDGTIKGKDYSGTWTIEGDTMCFSYGEAPDCWQATVAGDQITWIKDGVDGGTGTVLSGNPNGW